MDLDDKLKLIRKGRAAQGRARTVRTAWEDIDRDESLSVKEKLEKLINLTGRSGESRGRTAPKEPEIARREPLQFYENRYRLETRYGQIPISVGRDVPGDVLAFLSRDRAFESLNLSSALFVDLETTGLSGGTGTLAFLVGLGYYSGEQFKVAQFFLGEMAEEERLLDEFARFADDMKFRSLVTYNGKAFDIPLLETRFALHRRPFPLEGLPHLDFLFSARSLWKHKYESCRLFHLAREIVQADRSEDIPSAEIPLRYFQYIRTGDFSLIEPILYHNQEDILSLLGVVIAGAVLVSRNGEAAGEGEADAMDLVGVAKLFERAGDKEKSVSLFEKALRGGLTEEVSHDVKKKLAVHFKKTRNWEKAVLLWQEMGSGDKTFSFRELAMYYEHRERNYEEAMKAAEEGLALSLGGSSAAKQDFEKRIARIRTKLRRLEDRKGK